MGFSSVTVNTGPVVVLVPVCTETAPVVAVVGTCASSCVVDPLVTVASFPLKNTLLSRAVDENPFPVMVTDVPGAPL